MFKPFQFHQKKLIDNNIIIKNNQLRHLLFCYRKNQFLLDSIYLTNLFNYKNKINNNLSTKEKSFCQSRIEYINPKFEKLETFLLFTTHFQLNLLSSSEHIYIDGTFKSVPNNYYQLLTIHSYNNLI